MDYIYIRAWGKHQQYEARWVNDELQMARDDKAPNNVIFKREDATWATIEDIAGHDRQQIERIAGQLMRHANPLHPIEPPRKIM